MAVGALVVAIVSALGSVGAVWYARVSGRLAARQVALDAARRKEELAPRLSVSWERAREGDLVCVRVALVGPPGLEWVDDILLTVREVGALPPPHPGLLSLELAQAHVWAPYGFVPQHPGVLPVRTYRTGPVNVGEDAWCRLEHTVAPMYLMLTKEKWQQRLGGQVLRLWVNCERREWGRWRQAVEIDMAAESGSVQVP